MQVAAAQPSVRLALLIAAICAVFLMIGSSADAGVTQEPTVEYVVQPGDSLWSIATDWVGPEMDVRRLVADIRDVSGLDGAVIFPGQVLLIPTD